MFKFIEGLPQDVMAIKATGKVTHEDYRDTLIPKAEVMMGKGPIRMLYVIGPDSGTGTILARSPWSAISLGYALRSRRPHVLWRQKRSQRY
jgi:hypothetical protein